MFKFFLRKSFFDRWDHFLAMVIYNVFCFAVAAGYLYLANLIYETNFGLLLFTGLFVLLLFSFFSIGMSGVSCAWSKFQEAPVALFFETIKKHIGHVFFLFAIRIFDVIAIAFAIPYYLSTGTIWSVALAFALALFVVFVAFCQLIFSPLSVITESTALKCFNNCITYVFDNFGFCILVGIKTLIDFVVSALTILIIPGFAGMSVSKAAAARIILSKYVSSEDEMLKEEKEKIGERTIKNSFFPTWKKP